MAFLKFTKKPFLLYKHVYNYLWIKRTNNMDNKEYENRYQGTSNVLKIVGWILLAVGIVCVVIGMGSFFATMASALLAVLRLLVASFAYP